MSDLTLRKVARKDKVKVYQEPRQLEFIEPDRPEVDFIKTLHRADIKDLPSLITFLRRQQGGDGKMENVISLPASHLNRFWGRLRQYFETDGYFSINGFYENTPRQHSAIVRRGYVANRTDKYAQWITAVYVDMDCHNLGLSEGHVIGRLIDLEDLNEIPPCSVIVKSGRGVWAFWLLKSDHPAIVERHGDNAPVRAVNENKTLHRALEQKFCSILEPLGADCAATDIPRITRIPGSVNSKSGSRVQYFFKTDGAGKPFTYTLDDLCQQLFKRSEAEVKAELKKPKFCFGDPDRPRTAVSQKRREAQKIMLRRRLDVLNQLETMRSGFREGYRNRALLIIGNVLKQIGRTPAEIAHQLNSIGRNCQPALCAREIEGCIQQVMTGKHRLKKLTNQKIAGYLSMTPHEVAALGFSLYTPNHDERRAALEHKRNLTESRRACVRDLLAAGLTKAAHIQRALADRFYIETSKVTVAADLKAIAQCDQITSAAG